MTEDRLNASAMFDKATISGRGRSVRYLVIDTTSKVRPKFDDGRIPLNLALVLDASTSMAGAPMRAAKDAARGVINLLKPDDRISIVSFGHDVMVHLSGVRQTNNGREEALAAVDAIEHRMYTNLSGGWLKGAECVATVMNEIPNCHNHVILLSDGHANHGILDPLILRQHDEQLKIRGLSTSTVGIGDNYSATLLQELADFGGGRMHDAEHAAEINEVVMGELYELSNTYVDDTALHVRFPECVEIENVSGFPTICGDSELVIHLGPLQPASYRTTILRITTPPVDQGKTLQFSVSVSGKCPGDGLPTNAATASAVLTCAKDSGEKAELDRGIGLRVSQVWHASVVRRAADLNRQGEIKELKRMLDHEIKYLAVYCNELPEARYLVMELEILRKSADQDWHERLRKEMQVTSSKFLSTTNDHRPFDRDAWSTHFIRNLKDEEK